jgi:hypothetical protein
LGALALQLAVANNTQVTDVVHVVSVMVVKVVEMAVVAVAMKFDGHVLNLNWYKIYESRILFFLVFLLDELYYCSGSIRHIENKIDPFPLILPHNVDIHLALVV